ncbi:hypothetical protein SRHO_G00121380 [Serrasalmus rhombeus]
MRFERVKRLYWPAAPSYWSFVVQAVMAGSSTNTLLELLVDLILTSQLAERSTKQTHLKLEKKSVEVVCSRIYTVTVEDQ